MAYKKCTRKLNVKTILFGFLLLFVFHLSAPESPMDDISSETVVDPAAEKKIMKTSFKEKKFMSKIIE